MEKEKINVLSLFDGMACGMLAFKCLGIQVENYYAYEIDKYAVQTATHNFPDIQELGDVFNADFSQHNDIDWLVGGSPCTYWSIAQSPDKRETTASGMGWELFSQYVRALNEAKPKFFLYENNKSMSKAIYQSISETFGFEPICINSALVSAQNRQRLYWVGKRNADGTYSRVDIQQPKDKGILLKDVLDGIADREKGHAVIGSIGRTTYREYFQKNQGNMTFEPVNTTDDGKSQTIKAQYSNTDVNNICKYASTYGASGVAEPVRCFTLPREDGVQTQSKQYRVYDVDGKSTTLCAEGGGMGAKTGLYAAPIEFQDLIIRSNAHIAINNNAIRGVQNKNNASCAENFYEFTDTKANTLTTAHRPKIIDELSNYKYYGEACEWNDNGEPTKAISFADGKKYTVYTVKDGQITIKEKQYPIKLQDGYYIIRKLTVSECKRLQTVPEWYEFKWIENCCYNFESEKKQCVSAKLKVAINQLQIEKLNSATSITCAILDMVQQNSQGKLLTIAKSAKLKDAIEGNKRSTVIVSCITKDGSESNQLMKQKNVLCVESRLDTMDAIKCALGIMLSGCEQEILYLSRSENYDLMEMLIVDTTKPMTEDGFIELLRKKYLEENSSQKKLFIISTLINWIIVKTIYMYATTKPTYVCIDSLSDWQLHSLKMELLSLKMGSISGVSDSAAYKMLGNGWTVEVIAHLISSTIHESKARSQDENET